MSQQYIYEPRPIFSSHTPNLLAGSYYIDDGFQADPSMWQDPLEDAFVTNAGMIEGKNDDNITYLEDFSAETILMGTTKLDELEVVPQSYFWKWVNYDGQLQIPTEISEDDFEAPAYERFMEAAVGYDADNPYFLLVVDSFMDDGEDVDIWAEEADWNRMQTTELWWKLYDLWMENEGVDFLTTLAEENYDWALANAYELQQIGYEIPEPDDDDYYWSMRQAESFEVDYYVHSPDEFFGPYYNLQDAEDAIVRLEGKGIKILGISRGKDDMMAESFEAEVRGHTLYPHNDCEVCGENFNKLIICDGCGLSVCDTDAKDNMVEFDGSKKGLRKKAHYCKECNSKNAESFEAPYTGTGSLMGISGDTDLSSFTPDELTKSSAIHGDFDTASLDYSGHQNLEVRAEDEPDCDHGTTDMSGRCLHCTMTEADRMNEREGGGWEDCPTCGVAIKVGSNSCRNCSEQRVWTILIDDNDAYSETFVFNSKKSAINFREAAMDSEYLAQQDIGVYNIVEQLVIDEEYPSDPYIADRLSIDCLKCGDECSCDE